MATNGNGSAVVLARLDGTVISQNRSAVRLVGEGVGRPCWDVVGSLPGAEGLPCRNGCVGELLLRGLEHTAHTPFRVNGRRYHLWCVPCGETAVCVLDPFECRMPKAWERLTPREREVLDRLAEGETNPVIAARLGLSVSTVRTHIRHMLVKLDVPTRAGIVARSFRLGFLD